MRKANKSGCGQKFRARFARALSLATPLQNFWISTCEPYHVPYAFKHWYWTGLLLVVHVFVHVTSASNVSGDHGITLLAIRIVASFFNWINSLSAVDLSYKSWAVEVLEIASHANMAGLCLANFYTSQVEKSPDTSQWLHLFVIVLTYWYHIVTPPFFKTQLGKSSKTDTSNINDLVCELKFQQV